MRYEIKKLCGNRIMLWGMLVLTIVSLYYGYKDMNNEALEYVNRVEEAYRGEYTEEKLKLLAEEFENQAEGEDFLVYLTVYGEAQKCSNILEYRNNVLNAASRLKNSQDVYISRVNSRIEDIYKEMPYLEIVEATKFDMLVGKLQWQRVEDIISILLIIFAASYMFTLEHGANTHKLVFSSLHGRLKTYLRKIACIAIVATGLSTIATLGVCAYAFISGDSYIWQLPIQYYSEFIEAPYIMTMLEYVFVTIVIKAVGLIIIGVCSAVISLWFKKSIIPVIISSVLMIGGYLLCSYYANYRPLGDSVIQSRYEGYNIFKQYTCIGLVNNSGYYTEQYMPVNVLNYPVDMVYVNIIINVLFVMVVAIVGYMVYRKKDR